MSVPGWVQDAVFYQIFPDRFANGDHDSDPPNMQPWGSTPTSWGFQGGDLKGILQKFDYLLDLGINAIYLNPIFQATSTHRYNTTDYYRIDMRLGTMYDFTWLIKHAHKNQVRIILDGVFNHSGRGFFAFNDILENQEYSPYRDWYHIRKFPINAYSWGEANDYLGWWGMKSLPKFNTDNPHVRKYLLGVAQYWIEQGADGWRLDVPNEINDDSFWAEFRQVVKTANPEAYLVGEIWTPEARWVGDQHFDGLMNYPIMDALGGLLATNTLDVAQFAEKVESLLSLYPQENVYGMYIPLGTHDTERILTRMGNNMDKARLAYLFQFAYPGAPAIYYGDEIGMTGGKDPACRGAFVWDERGWNTELRNFIMKLIELRKAHPALRKGEYGHVSNSSNPMVYAFTRTTGDDCMLVVMNPSDKEQLVQLKLDGIGWTERRILKNLLSSDNMYHISNQAVEVRLPPWGGVWLA